MVGSKVKKKEIDEIVRRIDSMDRVSLLNALMQEHPGAKKKIANKQRLKKKVESREGFIELSELLNSIAETTYLQKPKPIAGQLSLFEDIQRWLTQFESVIFSNREALKEYITKVPEFSEVMLNFSTIPRIVRMAVWGINNRTGNIIHVNYAHSKELLSKEFGKLLDDELPQSPLYKERMKTREQSERKLKDYLKVWMLRDQGLTYPDIALRIHGSTAKVERVRKQFSKAYEIICGEKYNRKKYAKYKVDYADQKPCRGCPSWKNCREACPKLMVLLPAETKQRERPAGDMIDKIAPQYEDFQ